MQNWQHVQTVFRACNTLPKDSHGVDVMRVRETHLEGLAKHHRQTVVLASRASAEINALSRDCANVAGRARWRARTPAYSAPPRRPFASREGSGNSSNGFPTWRWRRGRREVQTLRATGASAFAGKSAARVVGFRPGVFRFRAGAEPPHRGGCVVLRDVRVHPAEGRGEGEIALRGRTKTRPARHRARAFLSPKTSGVREVHLRRTECAEYYAEMLGFLGAEEAEVAGRGSPRPRARSCSRDWTRCAWNASRGARARRRCSRPTRTRPSSL